MPLEEHSNCFQPLLTIFLLHGINFNKNQNRSKLRWISFARALMIYTFISGTVFVTFILTYCILHKMHDISQICLWATVQSLQIAAFIFYVTALKHQLIITKFLDKLTKMLALSSDNDAKAKSDFICIHRLCIWIPAIGFSITLIQISMSAFETYFGRFHITVTECVFHLIGYSLSFDNFHVFWFFVSFIYEFLATTFLHLYANMVLVICIALNICLRNLKQIEQQMSFNVYHLKHQQICDLIRQANSLVSIFLFITVIQDVVIVVLLSRILKTEMGIWGGMHVIPQMMQAFLSLCVQTYCASEVNDKVYTSLDTPPSVGSSDEQSIEDHLSHLIYVARLSSNKVGLTMWGFFVIGKGLIFTTIGTMVTYIIVLWQFG